jgi:hypothetical protein
MIGFRAFLLSTTVALLAAIVPSTAHADRVSTTGKGAAGGALLGGEAVLMVEAAFQVEPTWAYIVGGSAGAIGGGVGGYFLEDSMSPKVSMYLLTAGMALGIPAWIITLNATRYEPPDNLVKDDGTSAKAKTRRLVASAPRLQRPALPPALLGFDADSLNLGVPSVAIMPVFSDREVSDFGVRQRTELRLSLVNAVF